MSDVIVNVIQVPPPLVTVASIGIEGPPGATGPTGPAGPQGVQGVQGVQGTRGNAILNGAGPPSTNAGMDGDYWLDTTDSKMYGPKSGTWPSTGVSLIGPPGPAGPAGGSTFTYQQSIPAASATIVHNLNRFPTVTVVDSAGEVVEGDIDYVDANTITVAFSQPFTWTAYLE